jgi:4-carboxymuconolactone decarboxylase
MARVPLPTRESLPEDLQQRWDRLAQRGGPINIQKVFLAQPTLRVDVFSAWDASGLDARSRELVILRAAFRKQSTYEWHQHVRIAREAGISDAEINAIGDWRKSDAFSPAERALLAYVDALADAPRPPDDVFAAVSADRSTAEVIGLTFLITLYFQLAHVMAALELETEVPFVGWQVS